MAKIGVYVCWCGTNIANTVDVVKISEEIAKIPGVYISRDYKYMCSDPGQDLIIKDIRENKLDRVVVASCSPRMHELTFRKALEKAGLNPYLLEMANIREQASWVHEDKVEATKKSKDLIMAAIARVSHHEALDKRSVDIHPATLIIGAGITGMAAALEIADAGYKVFLIENEEVPGGVAAQLDLTFPHMYSGQQMVSEFVYKVRNHINIELLVNSSVNEINGYIGNYKAVIRTLNQPNTVLEFGNIIVATGLKPFDPSGIDEYGYGKFPDVITALEFEEMSRQGRIMTKSGKEPRNVAIIHCVGSRSSKYHPYCSRVCCMTALKYANQVRGELADANIFEIYADMRAFGKDCEEFYAESSKRNIKFLMYDQENDLPRIIAAEPRDKCSMLIELNEKLSGRGVLVPADMVILMTALEARETARDVGHKVGISMDSNKFFIEKHPKLDPVATTTHGVFITGCCQAPKDISESIIQGKAAAARILGTIARGSVEVEVTTAFVNSATCCGCQLCIPCCPYTAIVFDEGLNVAVINSVLCKGCGTCVALCRSKSIDLSGYTSQQVDAQIEAMFFED